jgi:hypothetical protein
MVRSAVKPHPRYDEAALCGKADSSGSSPHGWLCRPDYGVMAIATGSFPTLIGVPGWPVARSIGVTVPSWLLTT